MKFFSSTAGQYTVLLAVGVVGLLLIHRALKKDVTDTADALKHPFGQAFDDWVSNLFGGDTTSSAPDTIEPNFGLTDSNTTTWN